MENIKEELKIDYANHKVSNDYQEKILIDVIHCLLQYHYNSKDMELLRNFSLNLTKNWLKNH